MLPKKRVSSTPPSRIQPGSPTVETMASLAGGLLGDIARFVTPAATSGIGGEGGVWDNHASGLPCFPSVILDSIPFHSQIHPNLNDKLYGHPRDKTSQSQLPSKKKTSPNFIDPKSHFFFFFSFYGCTCSIWKFLGWVKSEPRLLTYTRDKAMQNLSCICDLQQCQICNPLIEARDQPASSWHSVRFLTC